MNSEEMNKYAYELMVKNNPREAVQRLMLLDKLEERIDNAMKYINETIDEIPHELYGLVDIENLLKILKGEE